MKPKIEPEFRIGNLRVVDKTDDRKNGYTVWRCVCDCGAEIMLDTRYLQRGTVTDCGCNTKIKAGQKDISGRRFGRLVSIMPTSQRGKSGGTVWKCLCDCGKECFAVSTQLTQGYKKSCGCLSRPPLKNYEGKRFGRLVVSAYEGKEKGLHRWRCLCDCGNETVVGQTLLQNGKTKSCGCLQKTVYKDNLQLIDGTSVTSLESSKNRLIATNSSGYNGVYLNRRSEKWIAQITFKGKTYYLGSYSKIEEAAKARQIAEDHLYGEFLKWYYETKKEGSNKNESVMLE